MRFLVVAVIVDVFFSAVLRAETSISLLTGQRRDMEAWFAAIATLYLLVVIYALVLVARDSTAMRGVIRRGERALAAHAETTNDWLWETTPELLITYCSPQVEKLLGYSPDAVVARNAHEFMTASTARSSQEALASGLATEGWHDIRSEWLHADGHVVALRHSGAPIFDDSGRLLGYRGRGTVSSTEDELALQRQELRLRVEEVISESSLNMALQPIINLHTGRMVGVEALARFSDGRPPDIWFDDAGKVGLRCALEMVAVQRALDRLPELPRDTAISINACPEVIIDPRFSDLLLNSGTCLRRVTLEITEHVRIDEYDTLLTTLDVLRAAGLSLAVDDAGAGYASLSHILRLRPDSIKLDRSIVAAVDADQARRTLIMALVLLALDIGATVTAEGIETAGELDALVQLGVDQGQGYLIGRPALDISTWPASLSA